MIRITNIRLTDGTKIDIRDEAHFEELLWRKDVVMDMEWLPQPYSLGTWEDGWDSAANVPEVE